MFETGEVAKRPFRRDEKNCYGVGVIDMKQGCLSMLHILEQLPAEVNEKLNIMAIFNPDEEVGSRWSRPILHRYAAICDKVFVFEAGGSHPGMVTVERKGQTAMEVTITGRAGHAGYMFENGSLSAVTEAATVYIPLGDLVDFDKELARLAKEQENLTKEIARAEGKLNNQGFVAKAPAALVEQEKAKLALNQQKLEQVEKRLAELKESI